MPYKLLLAFILLLAGCGPNKELAVEKFDPVLKDRVAALSALAPGDSTGESQEVKFEELLIAGTCDTTINGAMRKDLVNSGAQSLMLKGSEFTARVSSDKIYDVGTLKFVRQLRLQKGK